MAGWHVRRLWALVQGLGPDSALVTVMRTEAEIEAAGPRKVTLSELGSFFAGTGPGAVRHSMN